MYGHGDRLAARHFFSIALAKRPGSIIYCPLHVAWIEFDLRTKNMQQVLQQPLRV